MNIVGFIFSRQITLVWSHYYYLLAITLHHMKADQSRSVLDTSQCLTRGTPFYVTDVMPVHLSYVCSTHTVDMLINLHTRINRPHPTPISCAF